MSNYPPHYAYPSAPPLVRAMPKPPRLHWGWVLFLTMITFGLFGIFWTFMQGLWVKRATGRSKAFVWTLVYLLFIPVIFIAAVAASFVSIMMRTPNAGLLNAVDILARLGGFVLYIVAMFSLKGELEREPIAIPLSGGMTFFFGSVYFQYHLWDYDPSGTSETRSTTVGGLGLGGGPVVPIISSVAEEG